MNLLGGRRSKNIEDRRPWTPENIEDLLLGVGNVNSIPTEEQYYPGWRTDRQNIQNENRESLRFDGKGGTLWASQGIKSPEELEHQALVIKLMGELPGENTKQKREIASELITMSSKMKDDLHGNSTDYGRGYYMSDDMREALYRYFNIAHEK